MAPESHARLRAYYGACLRGEFALTHYACQGLHRDGQRFWLDLQTTLVPWGPVPALLTTLIDGTIQQQSEAMRERLAAIVDSSDDAIIGKTLEGHITSWNRGAERLYGYTAAEVLGQPITLLIPPDLPDELPAILERLRRGEHIEHYETQRLRKDGTRIEVSLTISPIRDSTGRIIGASKIARDITDRKRADAALRQARDSLEQRVQERTTALEAANAALRREIAERHRAEEERYRLECEAQRVQHFVLLGRLAAGVAHEIRNPLGAIFLHVDLLEEKLLQPSPASAVQVTQALTEIRTQLARLDDLVQDYLSLVRVAQIERTLQDLGAALQEWAAEWQQLTMSQHVLLRLEGLENLGTVAFHPSTLRRALLNLVHNALDAMPAGGTLTLMGQRTATQVQLQVQDTGSGIPGEQLATIFEPLYTTKPAGTGLGLYIVQEIVAAHRGQVRVESVFGQGTTFTVTLPCPEG
jgi:PAS domain S-box-containing protein